MNQTEVLELVREHCPSLRTMIAMSESGAVINELLELANVVEQESFNEGFEEGSKND